VHAYIMDELGVHLADRAVRAGGQQALSASLYPVPDYELLRWMAHVDQTTPLLLGFLGQAGDGGQPIVQTGSDIVPQLKRAVEGVGPGCGKAATAVGNSNDQGFAAGLPSCFQSHVGQTQVGLASGKPKLTQAPVRAPVRDAGGGFRRELISGIAEEHKVGISDGAGHKGLPVVSGKVVFYRVRKAGIPEVCRICSHPNQCAVSPSSRGNPLVAAKAQSPKASARKKLGVARRKARAPSKRATA